jgi:hypothetical protein
MNIKKEKAKLRKVYRNIAEGVLKVYNFHYLWMSQNTAIAKCADHLQHLHLLHHTDKEPKEVPELSLAAKEFFITINNCHSNYAIH